MSVLNGTYIEKMLTQHEIDFSDTEKTFFYVDKATNQYALRHIASPNPVPQCKVFLAGIWKCGECMPGIRLNPDNPLESQCSG